MHARAVIVGVSDYSATPLGNLPVASEDAESVAEIVRGEPYGYECELLLDSTATAAAVTRSLTEASAAEPDVLLFYFAGHGVQTAFGTFMATTDAEEFNWGVELSQAVRGAAGAGAQRILIVLDCCHAGAARFRGEDASPAQPVTAAALSRAYDNAAGSRALIAATGPDQKAYESDNLGHGVFTYYLIEGLLGAAADHTGDVTVNSLYDVAARPFAESARQTPLFRSDIVGRFVLAEGLEPALGPPLEKDVVEGIERDADAYLNSYAQMLSASATEWRTHTFAAACDRLSTIAAWFDKQAQRYPALLDRGSFNASYKAMRTRVAQLGQLEEGMRLREGSAVEVIGRGAFGTVWHIAASESYGHDLAYKVYHPADIWELEKTKRFRRGFDAMQQLEHPNIVPVFRFSEAPLGFFMTYIPGPNVRDLDPANTFEAIEIVRLLSVVSDAIAHAHARDIIHRDIKPENVICEAVEGDWKPHLTDFDLAWHSTATQVTKAAMGTPSYAAPEQSFFFSPRAVSERRPTLDVYSFGQLCFYCATGSDPVPVSPEPNLATLESRLARWPSGESAAQYLDLYEATTRLSSDTRLADFGDVTARLNRLMVALSPAALAAEMTDREFRRELIFLSTGRRPVGEDLPSEFTSVSGQTAIEFIRPGDDGARNDSSLTLRLRPLGGLSVKGASWDEARLRISRATSSPALFRSMLSTSMRTL